MKGRWTPIIQTQNCPEGQPTAAIANMAQHPTGDYVQYDDYEAAVAARDELERALAWTWQKINSAGLENLRNGVQLGATSWYVKMSDAKKYCEELLAGSESKIKGEQSGN